MDVSNITASAPLLRHKEDVRAALFHYSKDDGINKDILDRIVNHVIDSIDGNVMSILVIPLRKIWGWLWQCSKHTLQ